MDWLDLFKNALPVIVALLTVISAGVGIGFWLGRLSTHQRQTQTIFNVCDIKSMNCKPPVETGTAIKVR